MSKLSQYGCQSISEEDIAAVVDALRSGWLTTGPAVARFEERLAAVCEAPHACACVNGTAALWLAYKAVGVGPGDRVVVPAVTFAATATAALHLGARVEVVDVDEHTGNLCPSALAAHVDRYGPPALVVPVHYAGRPVDMETLDAMAAEHGFAVVEDACHALGAHDGEAPIGAAPRSRCVAFSFHPVKSITTGEGGAVTTTDEALAQRIVALRNHGIERDPARFERPDLGTEPAAGVVNPWYGELQQLGWNFRLSDIQAALGASQISRLPAFVERREALAERYDELLAGHPLITTPPPVTFGRSALHLYPVAIDFAGAGLSRAETMRRLRMEGVGTQVHYLPLHQQPLVRRQLPDPDQKLPGAERFYESALSLPLHPLLEVEEVDRAVEALETVLSR